MKSRFQSAWPGSDGRAGCSTRATSDAASEPARELDRRLLMPRKPDAKVRKPRKAEIGVLRARTEPEIRCVTSRRRARPCRSR